MRQIGTLPRDLKPQTFVDHLLALGIKARLDERPEGHDVWIYNEDQVARAREELGGYLAAPNDPRFQRAARAAEAARREERRLDRQFRKNDRAVSDQWGPPSFRRRPLTITLVALCALVFLLQRSSHGRWIDENFLFTTFHHDEQGREVDDGLGPILEGQVWRLITPIFLHSVQNPLHIIFNMMCLVYLGTMIELRRGSTRLLLLVLIAAAVSNLGQYFHDLRALDHAVRFGGFSGVAYAQFGYIWMKGVYEPEQGMRATPNLVNWALLWLVICMTGLLGPIANAAHVMGLISGMALGLLRF